MKHIDEVTREVIGVAMRIHRALGPGLLESVYETILSGKLSEIGYFVERQKPIDLEFEGALFPAAFKVDLLIDARLVIELKSVEQLHPAHVKQLLTYIRILKHPVGLLINFGQTTLVEGVRRLVNDHTDSASSASLREKI
jgi:iron complex transport system substrate-binding protein